jgi:hypothetical protein
MRWEDEDHGTNDVAKLREMFQKQLYAKHSLKGSRSMPLETGRSERDAAAAYLNRAIDRAKVVSPGMNLIGSKEAVGVVSTITRENHILREALQDISDKNTGGLDPDVFAYATLNPE